MEGGDDGWKVQDKPIFQKGVFIPSKAKKKSPSCLMNFIDKLNWNASNTVICNCFHSSKFVGTSLFIVEGHKMKVVMNSAVLLFSKSSVDLPLFVN